MESIPMMFMRHDSAACPDCGAPLGYGTKKETSSWKVYYACTPRCGWEQMAGHVSLDGIVHRDDVDERAREMGEQWTEP